MAVLLGRTVGRQLLPCLRGAPSLVFPYSVKINYQPYVEPKQEEYDIHNMKLKRPLSPHLTIYAKQLTSFMSITHRATGMALSGYFIALGCGALVSSHDISHYISMIEGLSLSAPTLYSAKYLLALPLGYHLANGVRHLLWDTGRALSLKEVYSSGYTVLALSVVISVALAAL